MSKAIYRVCQKAGSTLERYSVPDFRSRKKSKTSHEVKFILEFKKQAYNLIYRAEGIQETRVNKRTRTHVKLHNSNINVDYVL